MSCESRRGGLSQLLHRTVTEGVRKHTTYTHDYLFPHHVCDYFHTPPLDSSLSCTYTSTVHHTHTCTRRHTHTDVCARPLRLHPHATPLRRLCLSTSTSGSTTPVCVHLSTSACHRLGLTFKPFSTRGNGDKPSLVTRECKGGVTRRCLCEHRRCTFGSGGRDTHGVSITPALLQDSERPT